MNGFKDLTKSLPRKLPPMMKEKDTNNQNSTKISLKTFEELIINSNFKL